MPNEKTMSAEERAETLAQKLYGLPVEPFDAREIKIIAAALEAFAAEKVREAMENASEWIPNKTRAEAFEKAANFVECRLLDWVDRFERFQMDAKDAAEEIRALKHSEEKK